MGWRQRPPKTDIEHSVFAGYWHLRVLDGTRSGAEKLHEYYQKAWNQWSIILALLAGVEASALAIPGIETAHWTVRAFWTGGMITAIYGVLLAGGTLNVHFIIFFRHELQFDAADASGRSWDTDPRMLKLFHSFMLTTASAIYVTVTQAAIGFVIFCATVEFGADARRFSSSGERAGFALLAILPATLIGLHDVFILNAVQNGKILRRFYPRVYREQAQLRRFVGYRIAGPLDGEQTHAGPSDGSQV